MVKKYLLKYTLILIILQSLVICANSKNIDNLFYKFGYIKKNKYSLSLYYTYYSNNNNFTINEIQQENLLYKGYNINIKSNYINKISNGVNLDFQVQVMPPVKLFANYNYKNTQTIIDYTVLKDDYFLLFKDYNNRAKINNEEHTFLTGIELTYEYKYKKFIPHIELITAVGVSASSNYENIFYTLNFALLTGLYYEINKNIKLNSYIGMDYTSFYSGNYIKESTIINIPEEYLYINIPEQSIKTDFIYEEKYEKNINMVLGFELQLYKHYNLLLETKFINNLIINLGIAYSW